jgi:hypothetical protein
MVGGLSTAKGKLVSSAARALMRSLLESGRNLVPIVVVVAVFQALVIRQPLPQVGEMVTGLILMLIGLTLFVRGVAMSLLPLGEAMAYAIARRGSLSLLVAFAIALGFGSTFAEPALAAVVAQASQAAAADGLLGDEAAADGFALALRIAVSAAVGVGVGIGVVRIVLGWSAARLVLGGYGVVLALALATPSAISGIAFDAGAAATSAINIPLIVALGVGLAMGLRDRNPLVDGLGLVAFASVMPMVAIQLGGLVLLDLR